MGDASARAADQPGAAVSEPLSVVPARVSDVRAAVACHQAAFPEREFPGDAMPRLGTRFLRAHHRFYVDDPEGILLVAHAGEGEVAGFVLGGTTAVRRRFLARNLWRFALPIAWKVLTVPGVRRRALAGVRTRLERSRSNGAPQPGPPPEPTESWAFLYFLGTDPRFQGRGAGRRLLQGFEDECRRRGHVVMRLTTGVGNIAASELYRKCGWQIIGRTRDLLYFERRVDSEPVAGADPAARG